MDKKSNFNKQNVEKTSNWFKNVAKSLGYAGYASISESMPFVIGTFEDNKELIADAKKIFKSRSSIRLSNIIGDVAAKNIDSTKSAWSNIKSDIKTGKIYNKERLEQAHHAANGFGDDDWDIDFDDNDEEFSINVENEYDEDTETTRPHITINSNITEDNPMVTAIHGQSDIIVETAKVNAKNNAVIADLQIKSMNSAMAQLHGAIGTVNSNVSQIVEFNSNKMDSYVGASLNFYENQIKLMGELIESVKSINKPATRDVKKYENPYDDLGGIWGGFSLASYGKLVKKQLGEALDANIFTGSIKTMLGTEDAFLDLISNPLGFIPKTVISSMIPEMTKKIMESFNSSFENFIPLLFNKIYEWGDRNEDALGIKKLLGSTFGIKTHATTTIDSSKYEKGAVPFDGITKKAITTVIPTYLRKILAHLTGTNELVYNSEKGKWTTINTVKKTYNDELNQVARRSYGNIYDIKDEVNKLNLDPEQSKKFNESIDNFFANLSKSNKRFNPNETDSEYDLIKKLFKDNNGNVDNDMAETFRKIIKHLPKSVQMQIARDQLEGRVNVTNWIREREVNPDTFTDIVNSGILDRNLYKTQNEINNEKREAENRERERRKKDKTKYNRISDYTAYDQSRMDDYLNSKNDDEIISDNEDETIFEGPHRIKDYLSDKFKGITKTINKTLIRGNDAMYRIIFGDESSTTDNRSFLDKITDKITSAFDWFKKGFSKLTDKLIGDNGILTKLEQSEFMKKVKGGFGKAKNYLFGEQKEDGTYKNGLFSDVGNELVNMKNKVKDYIMGPDNENSILNNIKSMFGSFKNSVKSFLFGEDGISGAKEKAKGVLTDFGASLKDGFQTFANAFFGTKDKLKNGQLQNKINVDELTAKIKENVPKTIAGGIVGGGLGLIAGAGGFGLLGSLFLGPMSGVVIGMGTSILSRSEKFKDMLFGKNDENGERTGGFISKSVQNFFKDNKNYLIGGAALGTVHGLLGGLGILPSLVAGGPVTGAILGLGAGILRKSETFQSFMFGDLDEDGKRRNGLITKLTNSFNSDQAMKKLGHAGAGAILGGISGAALSSFGVLGSLSLGPLGGAIIGAGAGIALAADKWKEKIFGKFDEDGNRVEAGLLSKLAVMTSVNVLQPLKYKTMEWRFGVENWFEQKIALPIIEAVEPIKEEFHRIGGKLVNFIGGIAEAFHIPDIAEGFKTNVYKPIVNTFKNVANKAINGIGKITGWVLQKPVQLISMVVDKLIVPKHMREGLRDARKMILKNIVDSKPGQVITKTVSTVGNFTKGVISGVGDFAKKVITGTFKMLGKGLLAVVKAPFQAMSIPFKAIGKVNDYVKYKDRNYGSQETLHDIRSGNRGFVGSIGDLIQTFNPFSNIRASAKYQGVDMDAMRERAIKEKFTDKNGNIIPHTEQELEKEAIRLARKYPGGASYQEDRIKKAKEYRDKYNERANKRKDILEQYKQKIQENQEFASGLGYSLLSDEDREKVSSKELNKIEDSVYKKIYGKDYRNKTKFEQDRFKSQKASEDATIKMSSDVKDIRNALLGAGANVTVTNDVPDTPKDNPITNTMSSSSDSVIDFNLNNDKNDNGPSTALDRLNGRSEADEYRKNFLTDGVTWAEQKVEQEAEEKEERRLSIFEKILGGVEHGNETRDKSAFDWGRIFSKGGLITAGLLAALPFILSFFKDPAGSLAGLVSGLGSAVVGAVKEVLGFTDNDGNRTDSNGITQTNDDMIESGVRGGGQIASVAARKTASGINAATKAAQKVSSKTANLYNTITKNRGTKTATNVADNLGTLALEAGTSSEQAKAISKFMQILKTLPTKIGDFVKSKFAKSGASSAINRIIGLVDDAVAKITVKTLQGNYSKIARAMSYVVPGLNVAAFVMDVGFVTYGILSGGTKSETANLFHVNQKDVTAGMRTVSAGLKGILNYSWAFAFAIVSDLVYDMSGFDLLHNIAVIIYKYLLPGTDDEKLDTSISGFTAEYNDYTLKEQIRKGNVMYDEEGNVQYNEDGSLMLKEGAEVESFDSFNDRTNKSLWARMKEKITGKKSNLTEEEQAEQKAYLDEAYKNGTIDRKTYEEQLKEIKGGRGIFETINTGGANLFKNIKGGFKNIGATIFGREEDKRGIAGKKSELSNLEEQWKNGEIDGETYNSEVDRLTEEINNLMGKEGVLNKITGKIGEFASDMNTKASKWLNEPLTDENGNVIYDETTGQPVMKNEAANFIKHGVFALPGMASRIASKASSAANAWWNEQAVDENGNPIVDELTGEPVYNNGLHNFLTNGVTNLSSKVNTFGANIVQSVRDWWNSDLGDENNKKFKISDIGESISKRVTNLSTKINNFGAKISGSIKEWWDTEIKDEDGEKFKISDIGKYASKIFTSLSDKVVKFFNGIFDGSNTDGTATSARENQFGVTITSGETGWYNWNSSDNNNDENVGGADTPVGEKKAKAQSANVENNKTITNSASYKKKLEELIGLYRISSNYGYRTIGGKQKMHNGVDLVNANNAPVPSFTDGTVTSVVKGYRPDSGYYGNNDGGQFGNHVKVKDSQGNTNIYAHLNGTNVSQGQKISMGQQVGIQGHTGSSTGSHLHYEVRKGDTRNSVNPLNYLRNNFSTSDIGNSYTGSSLSDGTSTTTTIPAPDYLGLTTLSNTISESLTSSLEPFTKMSEEMSTLLGNYYGTNPATTVTTTSGDSSGSFGSSSGNSGSAEANAKRVYTALKAYGIPDVNIAGVLGNWTHESGIDPTGVEGIYDEKYTMGPKKTAAMANPNSYTLNTLFPKYKGKSINKKAYIGEDGLYYPGIGLGGFTGPATTKLIKFAKQHGMNWYDLDAQLQYASIPTSQGGYRDFMSGWKSPESSPAVAARVFLKKWEGINPDIGWVKLSGRQQVANEYYNKFKTWDGMGGSEDDGVRPAFGELPNINNENVSNVVDGSGDGRSPVTLKLNENFKKVFKQIKGINEVLDSTKNIKFNNNFETMTYTPQQTFSNQQLPVGGADSEIELPDKIYEILNNMVTYLSNIANNTAETSTNIKNIKSVKTEAKTSKSTSTSNTVPTDTMLDIANKQKNAKSSDAYKNARLIASGVH